MSVDEITELNQYLSFTIGNEVFALEIMKVREVLVYTNITKIPCAPSYMLGVINLRGNIVPVIDIRGKFGMHDDEFLTKQCIIIIEVMLKNRPIIIGALVDTVKEVFELETEQIEPPPKLGTNLNSEFIVGMGKHNDNLIILLDIDKVFSNEEIYMIENTG